MDRLAAPSTADFQSRNWPDECREGQTDNYHHGRAAAAAAAANERAPVLHISVASLNANTSADNMAAAS